jgi:hypothetical protein
MSKALTANMTAKTTAAPLVRNPSRSYLMVVATTDLTVVISGGTSFIIPAGQAWEPSRTPMNDIVFTAGTGTVVEG